MRPTYNEMMDFAFLLSLLTNTYMMASSRVIYWTDSKHKDKTYHYA